MIRNIIDMSVVIGVCWGMFAGCAIVPSEPVGYVAPVYEPVPIYPGPVYVPGPIIIRPGGGGHHGGRHHR